MCHLELSLPDPQPTDLVVHQYHQQGDQHSSFISNLPALQQVKVGQWSKLLHHNTRDPLGPLSHVQGPHCLAYNKLSVSTMMILKSSNTSNGVKFVEKMKFRELGTVKFQDLSLSNHLDLLKPNVAARVCNKQSNQKNYHEIN